MSIKKPLLAYAAEFIAQDGAMDPDHSSPLARNVCEVFGTGEWYAEINPEGDHLVDFFVYGEPLAQADTAEMSVEVF